MLRSLNATTLLAMAGTRAAATAGAGFGFEHSPYLSTPNSAVNMDEEDGEDIELEEHISPVDHKELTTLAMNPAADISYDAAEYTASRPVVTKAMNNKIMNTKVMNNEVIINQVMNNKVIINQVMNKKAINNKVMHNTVMDKKVMNDKIMDNKIMNNKVIKNEVMNNKAPNRKGKSKEGKIVKKSENSPGEQTLVTPDIDHAGNKIPLMPGYKAHEYRNRAITNAIAKVGRMSYRLGYHMSRHMDYSRSWLFMFALRIFIQPLAGHVLDGNTLLASIFWLATKIGISMFAGALCFGLTYGGRHLYGHRVKWVTLCLGLVLSGAVVALQPDPRARANMYWLFVNLAVGFILAFTTLFFGPSIKVVGMIPDPEGLAPTRSAQEMCAIRSFTSVSQSKKLQLQDHYNCSLADVEEIVYGWRATVLHISAHGSEDGMGPCFQRADDQAPAEIDSTVLAEGLAGKGLKLIVLNACYSANYAQLIANITGAKVVGWEGPVKNKACITFSKKFYGLLADGVSYDAAFKRAYNAILYDVSYQNQKGNLFSPQG